VVLDLTLPKLSGTDTLAGLQKTTKAPVVILTAVSDEDPVVESLRLGAFDIAMKPFEPDDLEATVKLAAGITPDRATSIPSHEGGNYTIDFAAHQMTRNELKVPLSLSEWRFLELLAARPGETILYQEILTRLWGPRFRTWVKFLDLWAARLQKKVGIAEFHGVGYSLDPDHH
jgi:DNA-binding response OmpR family regulator